MYFILKVKYVDGNIKHPRHKIVHESESLEEALKSLEDIATKYIIKKIKPSFTEDSDDSNEKTKVHYETKYTMNRNKHDNNIIEIHEKVTKTERKPGTLYGETEKVTRSSTQVGYFCYVKYNFVAPVQTCDNCLMVINRPVPQKVPQSGANPALLKELRNNALFQTLQDNSEKNRLDMTVDDSTDIIDSDDYPDYDSGDQ